MVSGGNNGRDRRKGLTTLEAFLCILAIFGTAIVLYATGSTLGSEAGRNQENARQHYESKKENALESCSEGNADSIRKCVVEAVEAAQEDSIAHQDLYAQQDMSRWAFWLLILTVATFLLSAGGLLALLETIQQGHDSNEIARKAMSDNRELTKVSLQPYVYVEQVILKRHSLNPNVASISVVLKNYGATPALYIRPSIGWQVFEYPIINKPNSFGFDIETVSEIAPQMELAVPHPIADSHIGSDAITLQNNKRLLVYVAFSYENRIDRDGASWSAFFVYDGKEQGFRRLTFSTERVA